MDRITAHFRDGRTVNYTMAIWDLLVSDDDIVCICDSETGVVLFYRQ